MMGLRSKLKHNHFSGKYVCFGDLYNTIQSSLSKELFKFLNSIPGHHTAIISKKGTKRRLWNHILNIMYPYSDTGSELTFRFPFSHIAHEVPLPVFFLAFDRFGSLRVFVSEVVVQVVKTSIGTVEFSISEPIWDTLSNGPSLVNEGAP